MLSVVVEQEVKVFEMASKARQRVNAAFKLVCKSVPSRWTGVCTYEHTLL